MSLLDRIHRDGLTYDAYQAHWQDLLAQPTKGLDKDARKLHFYRKYNAERSAHVRATYAPSDALRDALAHIETPQTWLVLTEAWCGDSAFNLPVIVEAAGLSPHVTLRILLRDANTDLIERYHTNGSHSIPKLIAFDADGQELFTWGPRPAEAQAYMRTLLDSGLEKPIAVQRFTEWVMEKEAWTLVDRDLAALVAAQRGVNVGA
jgi:hypothetical protein